MKYLLYRVSVQSGHFNAIICGAWLSKRKSLKEWEFWKQRKKGAWSNVIRQGVLEPWGTINKGSGTCRLQPLYFLRERFRNFTYGTCFLFLTSTHRGSESLWMFVWWYHIICILDLGESKRKGLLTEAHERIAFFFVAVCPTFLFPLFNISKVVLRENRQRNLCCFLQQDYCATTKFHFIYFYLLLM